MTQPNQWWSAAAGGNPQPPAPVVPPPPVAAPPPPVAPPVARAAPPAGPAIDYQTFHADSAVIRDGQVTIPVNSVTGWAAKLTRRTTRVNGVTTGRSTQVLFRVTGPGTSRIDLRPRASGTSRKSATGHANMEQLNRALVDYGVKVIAPVLVPRLCQQVVSGVELTVGRLTISQAGLTKQGVFGVKTLAWPDFYGTGTSNGRVILFRRKQPGSSQRRFWPWFKVDMSVTNGIVLPSVLPPLYRYFVAK